MAEQAWRHINSDVSAPDHLGYAWRHINRQTSPPTASRLSVLAGGQDEAAILPPLDAYTVLPLVVDGRGATALLCTRHDDTPVMLLPGTNITDGPLPVDQRGLNAAMVIDAIRRHEREHHP